MPREEIIFPPFHITLGLMKLFVKGIDETEQFFQYILLAFPGLSSEKLKAGVFDNPQILSRVKGFPKALSYGRAIPGSMGQKNNVRLFLVFETR